MHTQQCRLKKTFPKSKPKKEVIILKTSKKLLVSFLTVVIFAFGFSFFCSAAKAKAPKVTKIQVTAKTTSSVTVKWTTSGKVTGYRIYTYNTKTKKYKKVANSKKKTYTLSDLDAGENYVIGIRAYYKKDGKTYNSQTVRKNCYTTLDKVTGIRQTSTGVDNHSLSWKKVKGAEKYEIWYYKQSTQKYTFLGETKKNRCTLSRLKGASEYKYKIRAVSITKNNKKVNSKFSSVFSAVTAVPSVTGFKASAVSDEGYTLKWNAAENVQGYYLFKFSGESGEYEELAILNTNEYTVSGKENAQKDSYKVCAYATVKGKRVFGAETAVLTASTKPSPTTLYIDSDYIIGRKANLSWDAVENADGYLIYVSDKPDSGFVLKKEISGANIKKASITGLDGGKRLYFRIKSFVDVGSYVCSDNSNTVQAYAFS